VAIVAGISGAAEAWPPKGSFVIAGDLKQPTLMATADVLTNLHHLAVIQDGQPLTQPRLVVPGDIHGGRYVSDVISVRLGRVPDDPVIQFLPIGQ